MNNVILVIIFFKVSMMDLVRHDNSIADLCLKTYSFLCFSLDGNWWLSFPDKDTFVNESWFSRLGDQNKEYLNL